MNAILLCGELNNALRTTAAWRLRDPPRRPQKRMPCTLAGRAACPISAARTRSACWRPSPRTTRFRPRPERAFPRQWKATCSLRGQRRQRQRRKRRKRQRLRRRRTGVKPSPKGKVPFPVAAAVAAAAEVGCGRCRSCAGRACLRREPVLLALAAPVVVDTATRNLPAVHRVRRQRWRQGARLAAPKATHPHQHPHQHQRRHRQRRQE